MLAGSNLPHIYGKDDTGNACGSGDCKMQRLRVLFNAVGYDMVCPVCKSADMEILSGNDLIVQELICR